MKVLHHHCYLDDFLKLFRAVFNDCVSSFASAKIWLRDWKNKLTLREKFPDTEFILVRIFPHSDWIGRDALIRTEYGEIWSISSYSVQMRENTDQKKLRIWTPFRQRNAQQVNAWDTNKLLDYSSLIIVYYC